MANVLDCDTEIASPFGKNTLDEGLKPLIGPAMG